VSDPTQPSPASNSERRSRPIQTIALEARHRSDRASDRDESATHGSGNAPDARAADRDDAASRRQRSAITTTQAASPRLNATRRRCWTATKRRFYARDPEGSGNAIVTRAQRPRAPRNAAQASARSRLNSSANHSSSRSTISSLQNSTTNETNSHLALSERKLQSSQN
jgi:hypothetical protein